MIKIFTLYSTIGCSKCKTLKDYCVKNNIEFNEINISEDMDALAKLRSKKLLSLPVIEKDEAIYSLTTVQQMINIINEWNKEEN